MFSCKSDIVRGRKLFQKERQNMKLLVTGRLYPYIMRRCMKKQLEEHFSRRRTKVILKRAKKEYFKIVKRAPDIGEKDNFFG